MNKTFTHNFIRYLKFKIGLAYHPAFAILCVAFLCICTPGRLMAQSDLVTVKGSVVDDGDSQPLAGVTITNAAKRGLGITNINGEFSITVPRGSEFSFGMVGYAPTKLSFKNNENKLVVRLKQATSQLNEVVVTALGIKREERALGYSAPVVKGEELTNAISANWTDALSGKVPGLNLVRSNSGPAGSNKIILRGENNLTGNNEALIVIDGVVTSNSSGRRTAINGESTYGTSSDNMPADYGSSLNDINPQDIESVTVLKGAAAAALYGQRGANGAVLITTKSGIRKNHGLGITFSSNASIEQVNRWPDMQFQYGQGLAGANYYSYGASADGASTSGTSSAYGPKFDGQLFYQYDPITQAQGTTRTPWVAYPNKIHQYFETGKTYTNQISVDGGTDKTSARFSATNVKNEWIIPNTGYTRNSVSMSFNSKVNDKLSISSKVIYNNRNSDNLPGAGYGNQSPMYWFIFWQPNADLDWLRNYWKNGQVGRVIQYPYSSFPENPYAVSYEFINKTNRNEVTGNIQATYNFSKELSLQLRTSLDMSFEQREQDRPYDAGSKFVRGSYRTQDINSQESSADFLLRYNKNVNKDINITTTLGGSLLSNKYNKDEVRADSLTIPQIYKLSNAAGTPIVIPDASRFKLNSAYALVSSSYKDFLYLDVTARQDYTSTLATPERTANVGFFYPSISGSFIASEVFKLPKQISYAKLRASYAEAGSGGTTPYLTSYNYAQPAGGVYPGGALQNPTILTNPDLESFRSKTYELGADIRLFNSRLNFDITLYSGNTNNQILTRQLDRASGYNGAVINFGRVNNRGIEIGINGNPVRTNSGFNWTAFFNFSANRNRITQLGDSAVVLRTGPVGGGQIVANVGGSTGDLYGRGYVRAPDGQVVYDATTGIAKISQNVVYLGNTTPKFKTSVGSNFSYKQFSLNVLFDAQFGAVAHSLMNYKMVEQGKLTSTLPGRYSGIIGNGVVQNADGSYSPNTTISYDIDAYYRSHMGVDNAEGSTFSTDFIKFREASFNYTLPPGLTRKLGLQRATVGVYGRDLFIWSPWPMFDPEFGTLSGTDIVTGFEVGQFPSTRTLGVNLIVQF